MGFRSVLLVIHVHLWFSLDSANSSDYLRDGKNMITYKLQEVGYKLSDFLKIYQNILIPNHSLSQAHCKVDTTKQMH